MNTPIKTIVLSVSMACLSSVAMAGGNHGSGGGTVVSVDTNLTNTPLYTTKIDNSLK